MKIYVKFTLKSPFSNIQIFSSDSGIGVQKYDDCKSKKDRQHNDQKKKDESTMTGLQNITQRTIPLRLLTFSNV